MAAGGEPTERVREPGERVPGELLADEIADQGREDGPGLVSTFAVAGAESGPEREEDERHHPDEADETELPEHLELEVVRHVALPVVIFDGSVVGPGGEEGGFAHAEERMFLEDPPRDLPRLHAVLDGEVFLVGGDGLVALPERGGRVEDDTGRGDEAQEHGDELPLG